MNRREFLATAGVTPLAAPILLGMQDKAGTKAPVLGTGANDRCQLENALREDGLFFMDCNCSPKVN